jgi:hypothetical protein
LQNRQEAIRAKGFNIVNRREVYEGPTDYKQMKVGTKKVDDAILNLGSIAKVEKRVSNKELVIKAMAERDLPLLREISNYFYNTNGIYSKVCDYFAFMYRYDWYTVPEILDDKVKTEQVLKDFTLMLHYLDNSHIKKVCGDIDL